MDGKRPVATPLACRCEGVVAGVAFELLTSAVGARDNIQVRDFARPACKRLS